MNYRFAIAICICLIAASASHSLGYDRPTEGRIVSVRPAVPDGAKAFVAQQSKPPKPPRKPLFDGWFKKKPAQPKPAAAQGAKPSAGQRFKDFFDVRKWGKKKPEQAADPNQQQVPQNQFAPGASFQGQNGGWTQQTGGSSQFPAQPDQPSPYGQMPPPNVTAPASQPG